MLDAKLGRFMDIFSVLSLNIPTLFKLMPSRLSGARDLAYRTLNLLNNSHHSPTLLPKIKICLFLISIFINQKNEIDVDYLDVKNEIDKIEELYHKLSEIPIKKEVLSYISYARAYYFYKGYKYGKIKDELTLSIHNKSSHRKQQNKESQYGKIIKYIKEADQLIEQILTEDESLKVAQAKLILFTAKVNRTYNKPNESNLIKRLEISITIFNTYKMKRLEMITLYFVCLIPLE